MTSYYDILGISQSAGVNEIKRAFRRLAKLYHPDKNPGEKELFAGILKAYETLVDPALRSGYDRTLRYQQQNSSAEKTKSKNWTFEEREQRRRKYYEEHIKQYDEHRETLINELGITVLRFTNDAIFNDADTVIKTIETYFLVSNYR